MTTKFADCVAVVTGGGTGMGRELVRQLTAAGCHVSMCDVNADEMAHTMELARSSAPATVRMHAFAADVSDETQMRAFADECRGAHGGEHINLLFNNAGIGGGGSFVTDSRESWDKTFGVCWGGVYGTTRAFLPLLLASSTSSYGHGHVVNTSSVNGFWASLGLDTPHTAYSAAKFAVKGFTEALITDFRIHAPHLSAHVVMPGHIGTSIALNSMKLHGRDPKELTAEQVQEVREGFVRRGLDMAGASDEDIRNGMQMMGEMFRDAAPMTAEAAAAVILAAVSNGEWRILVGDDALGLDGLVRAHPTEAYAPSFNDRLREAGVFGFAR
jgi:NAD(P)-dependent dehydrogenase (short-subunit alcohol dehydrogenase family)